jgi:hypothetical protein
MINFLGFLVVWEASLMLLVALPIYLIGIHSEKQRRVSMSEDNNSGPKRLL